MRTALHLFCRSITIIMTLLMAMMLIIINTCVVTRYFFSYSPPWKEELTCYCMVWMVMLGAGILTLFHDHITLYTCIDKLPPRGRYWQQMIANAMVFASGVFIAWTGFDFAFGMQNVVATGLETSMLWPTLAVPVGAVMVAVLSGLLLISSIIEILGGPKIKLPDHASFMDSSFNPE